MSLRMPSINQVSIAGRLTADPEFRIMDSGVARLGFQIAVNRSYRDGNDEWQEETSFFHVVAWRKLAERLGDILRKGLPVFIHGRLQSSKWQDDDGNPHSIVSINAFSIQTLEKNESPLGAVTDNDNDDFDF
jgi:single-strand DNA-binding protein